tara:strand:+ start:1424 stop:2125 length:702 start_codon:yes stop_codon:yes gene_type:complete
MIKNFKRFLFVVAHPDDETLGCGGILKKLSKLKKNVRVISIAEGSSCRYKNINKFKKEINNSINQRKKWGKKALSDLGIKNFHFYDLTCGKLSSYPITSVAKLVEEEISQFKPQVIFTHSNNDVNMDHRIVFQACLQATRPTKSKDKILGLISFEILSSTEWKYIKIFEPNYFINIEKEIKFKIKAMKRYRTEIKSFPYPRSSEGISSLAKYRGMQSHHKFAEAFKIIRFYSE